MRLIRCGHLYSANQAIFTKAATHRVALMAKAGENAEELRV